MACAPGITGFLQTTLDRLRQWYGVSTPVKVMPHISIQVPRVGLGFAMAEALAEVGATVILNGRDANTLKIVAGRICDRGLSAETSAFDVTDRRAADSAIQSIVAHHQRLDILIANAGVTHRAQLADWTEEAWNSVLAANLSACFFLAQSAAAPMRAKGMDE